MALRVWLPLDGSLENQGVSAYQAIGTDLTVDNNGKIGKSYSFNGTSSKITIANFSIGNNWSYGAWIYSPTSSRGWEGAIILNTNGGDADMQLGFYTYPTGNKIQSTANGQYNSGISMTYGQWNHLFATFDGSSLKTYINGVLVNTKAITNSQLVRANLTIGARCRGSSYDCFFSGKINDIRIYDHCLSAAEVHEISQGLVLHYKLDSLNNNLFKLTPQGYHPTDYCGYNLGLETNLVGGQQYTVQLWDVTISHSGKTNTQLNLQLYWGGGNNWLVTFANSNFTNGHADYLKATFTAPASPTNATEAQNAWINAYNSPSYASGTLNMHIGAWKIEKGGVGTQWSGNDNIIQDSSGYGHNGTINGTLTLNSNTARYSAATYFNGTDAAIQIPFNDCIKTDDYTVSVWTYKSVIGEKAYQTILGGPSGFELEARSNTNTSPLYRIHNWGGGTTAYDLNKWNLFTFVRTASDSKLYVNGELKLTGTTGNAPPSGNYFIGAWKTATQQNYDGYMSDFRIYCTALSADDVLSLYHTAAKIDKLGNWHTFEFTENSSIAKVKKTGITQANEVHDNLLFRNKAQIIKNNAQILIQGDLNIVTTKSGHTKIGGIPSLPGATVKSLAGKTLRFVYDVCAPGARYSTEQGQTAWSYTRYGIHGSCSLDGSANYPFAGQLNYSGNSFHAIQTWTIPTGKSTYGDLGFSIQNFDKPASTNNDTWFIRNVRLELIEGISEDITGTTLIEF